MVLIKQICERLRPRSAVKSEHFLAFFPTESSSRSAKPAFPSEPLPPQQHDWRVETFPISFNHKIKASTLGLMTLKEAYCCCLLQINIFNPPTDVFNTKNSFIPLGFWQLFTPSCFKPQEIHIVRTCQSFPLSAEERERLKASGSLTRTSTKWLWKEQQRETTRKR